MYSVFLVDDEPIILEGLTHIIDWQRYGLRIAGTYDRASTALKAAVEHRPDLVITDIEMPGMNGLNLICQMRQSLPDTLFVILSAHHQFAYAQEAIRQGAYSYLLKPIDEDELSALLRNAQAVLAEREVEQRQAAAQLLARVLTDGVEHCPPEERAAVEAFLQTGCRLIYVWDSAEEEKENPVETVRARLEIWSTFRQGSVWVFLTGQEWDHQAEGGALQSLGNATVTIGNPLPGRLEQVGRQHRQELEQLQAARFFRTAPPCALSAGNAGGGLPDIRRTAREIVNAVERGGVPPAISDALCREIADSGCTREQALGFLDKLLEVTSPPLEGEGALPAFRETPHLEDALLLCLDRIAERMDALQNSSRDGRSVVGQVERYLQAHFRESDLRLSEVAARFYINYSYLSSIFKKETGVNFYQYLQKIRIGEAKRLLAGTRLSVGEVAHRAGYSDTKNFHHAFKRQVGCSPNQYRERLAAEHEKLQ